MNPSLLRRLCLLSWLGVILWAGGIFYASSLSGHELARIMPFQLWDKLLHALAFAGGAVPLTLGLRLSFGWPLRKAVLVTVLLVSAYGASDEWHQQFTPGRAGKDVGDWTADTLGAAVGALSTALLYVRFPRPSRPAPARA